MLEGRSDQLLVLEFHHHHILLSFYFSFSFKMSSSSSTPLPSLGVLPEASNKINGGKQKQKEPSSSSTPKQSSLRIEIDGKPALIRHDDEFLYVYRGDHQEDETISEYIDNGRQRKRERGDPINLLSFQIICQPACQLSLQLSSDPDTRWL